MSDNQAYAYSKILILIFIGREWKKMYKLKSLLLVFTLANAAHFDAQLVITEQRNETPNGKIKSKTEFPSINYTSLSNAHGRNVWINKSATTVKANKSTAQVSANLNLTYDSGQFYPLSIVLLDESGNVQYANWEGDDNVSVQIPEGTYDIMVQYDDFIENHSRFIVKELQTISEGTNIDIDVNEANHYISLKSVDETGSELLPGVSNPTTGVASKIFLNRFLYSNAKQTLINGAIYIQDNASGTDPMWNFYINSISDRFAVLNSFIVTRLEKGSYALKHQPVNGITQDTEIVNNKNGWVQHE